MPTNRYALTLQSPAERLTFITTAESKYDARMQTAAWLESLARSPRNYKIVSELIGDNHDKR